MLLTYKYRIKDSNCSKRLDRMATAVNQVWNYCGQIQNDSKRLNKKWPSAFDLINLTSGSSKELGLQSGTIQAVCKQFVNSRDKARKRPKWRMSSGSKRSLGWIPLQSRNDFKVINDVIIYLGKKYRFWRSRAVPNIIKSGSFSQDAIGRWYVNIIVDVPVAEKPSGDEVLALDLGVKEFATMSNGEKIENPRFYRCTENELAYAQSKGQKRKVTKLNRKIKNQRKHFHHTESSKLSKRCSLIVVGDVNSAQLAKTKLAKSVLDAGWSAFRSMLLYKANGQGARYLEVSERMSTQTCSNCLAVCGPRGLEGLRVRTWVCESCGSEHERDHNAAKNILRSGQSIVLQNTKIPGL